jgi:hypothetical protein
VRTASFLLCSDNVREPVEISADGECSVLNDGLWRNMYVRENVPRAMRMYGAVSSQRKNRAD